ncbi:MAG TPA: M20/M25/M40 family metallo-hydrolase [Woeseiaceae bacterium]|nr:M20/M25/M40 family metallo-hydrolase [Woeseiaceae bacterium]
MWRPSLAGIAAVLLAAVTVHAEPPATGDMRHAVRDNIDGAVALYREFLAQRNDALHPDDIEALVTWMEGAFGARGFRTQRIPTDGNPALFAERRHDAASATVLVYLQADGQPVDPAAWAQADPFVPVLKARDEHGNWQQIPWGALEEGFDPEWRVFARSAADSKGPMTQFMMAVELLDELDAAPPYNLKVIIDTEEELGSPNLAAAIRAHRELLAADLLLIFDGPPHASNRPTVTFGARGIMTATLVAYGPYVAQHSGHYGNFVPNPAFDLARILASLKSPAGVVTIPGFYDGVVLSDEDKATLSRVPDEEARILADMGLARAESVAPTLQEAIQYPSLNVRGMSAGWVGEQARTIIPPTATAEIDIRLVPESDPERLMDLLRTHVESLGYTVLDHAPDGEERRRFDRIVSLDHDVSYGAFRSEMDSPAGMMARQGLAALYGEEPILIRTMGGSIPIAPIIDALGVPAAIVPTVNIDNNQHSPNENLRLGNFVEGIVMLMAVLSQVPR